MIQVTSQCKSCGFDIKVNSKSEGLHLVKCKNCKTEQFIKVKKRSV